MNDAGVKPVGTVAEEAARLLEALGGWAKGEHEGGASDRPDPKVCEHCGAPAGGASAQESGATDPDSRPAAVAAVCRVCPICQGVGLLRSLQPETIDRLAELAGAVMTGLRDLANQTRAASPDSGAQGSGATEVEDISVIDEDDHEDDHEDPHD